MGLMDKVKAQATQLAQKTQEAAQEGKARLDQAQANRRGDMLLRQLGAAVYAERTGRGAADSQARIDQLISAISVHERENGLNLTEPTVPQPGSPADAPGGYSGTTTTTTGATGPTSAEDVHGGSFGEGKTFFTPPEDSASGPDSPRG